MLAARGATAAGMTLSVESMSHLFVLVQVASEAAAREKALLAHQLTVTEQQLAECAQDMQCKQQEVQQLQAAEQDRAVHLHKAQLRGSSNEHGLRGLQQRLQEVMQDKRALDQTLDKRLQSMQQVM